MPHQSRFLGAHTHSQYAQVVCLRKRNIEGDQNIEIKAVEELLNFIGADKHLSFCHYIQLATAALYMAVLSIQAGHTKSKISSQ